MRPCCEAAPVCALAAPPQQRAAAAVVQACRQSAGAPLLPACHAHGQGAVHLICHVLRMVTDLVSGAGEPAVGPMGVTLLRHHP